VPQIDINSNLTDALAPAAHEILNLDKAAAYQQLVVTGGGNESAAVLLRAITPEQLLIKPLVSRLDADAMLAGLWLWHDWLDSSHTISQSISNATGSFWHAIMHRREGDFSNAKYWYARCTSHPVLQTMTPFVNDILHPLPADKSYLRLTQGSWNPNAFVDLAEELHRRPATDPRHNVAIALQKLEWRLLFDHCTRAATGQ
jgi:hypothetical protein